MSNLITTQELKNAAFSSHQPKYDNAQLLQLLSTYEAELQSKEIALAVLKVSIFKLFLSKFEIFSLLKIYLNIKY